MVNGGVYMPVNEQGYKKWKDVLYLASSFHDIGKFRQRGKMSEELKSAVKKEYNYEIKTASSGLAHQFVGAYIYKNSKLPYREEVSTIISKHHDNLQNLVSEYEILTKIVSIADRISSNERTDYSAPEDEKVKYMKSIISKVSLANRQKEDYYRPLTRFSLAESVRHPKEFTGTSEEHYERLWKEFEPLLKDNDLENLWRENPEGVYERLYYLLKEYTSTVPSAFYYSEPDISLFSHASSTAAIAVALYAQLGDKLFEKQNDRFVYASSELSRIEELIRRLQNNQNVSSSDDPELFGVIKGDISGIQDFIYKTSIKNGLKKLRARSFFIAYLAEIIAKYIVRKEGLYNSNILYCGGGHFYLLVPASTIDRLDEYQNEIDKKMYNAFGLDLSVLLGGIKINFSRLLNFDVHDELARLLEQKKNKKFSTVVDLEMFLPEDFSGPRCPYCGRRMRQVGSNEYECEFCESFVDIGYHLANSKYLTIEPIPEITRKPRDVFDVFRSFGFELTFDNEPNKLAYAIEKSSEGTYDPMSAMYPIKMASYVSRKYIGKGDKQIVADLETIADESKGVKRWAILRGDVDNLGSIFKSLSGTFGQNVKSAPISYVATLSSELEMFFSVVLERFVREEFENCNVIYSGGDDFMILGPWNELPLLADTIRKRFFEFSKNDELSISMAIAIAPSKKYPVYKLGTIAGELLDEKAKSYKRNGKEKAALYFLRGCIGWEEFDKAKELKDKLQELIEKYGVTKNLLHVLDVFANRPKEQLKIWRLYYYVGRLMEREDAATKKAIKDFFDSILVNYNQLYPKLDIVVRWVHDETRKVEHEEEEQEEISLANH